MEFKLDNIHLAVNHILLKKEKKNLSAFENFGLSDEDKYQFKVIKVGHLEKSGINVELNDVVTFLVIEPTTVKIENTTYYLTTTNYITHIFR